MLNPSGYEEDSDNSSSNKSDNSNKEENQKKSKIGEKLVGKGNENNNNILNNNDINVKNSLKESDNFFKGDSNNYDIIPDNKKSSENFNNINDINNNDINNNKQHSIKENSNEDFNFTSIDDDNINNSKEENKKENNTNNNNNLLELNKSIKLENIDNINNIKEYNIFDQNKDNNSESNDEEKKEKEKIELSNNNNNKSLNNHINNNDINNKSSNKNEESKSINSLDSSSDKSKSEEQKEKNNSSNSQKHNNLSQNLIINNKKDEENNINGNNINIQNKSEIEENNNINNKEENNKNSLVEEENKNNISIKKDNNINENIINNIDNKVEDKEEINNNKVKQNFTIKFPNNKEDNNSSNNKKDDEFSEPSNPGSEKNSNKEIVVNNENNFKTSDSLDTSEISRIEKMKSKDKDNDKIETTTSKLQKKVLSELDNKFKINKKDSGIIDQINYIKDEYYINFIKLKGKGFKDIKERNYSRGYTTFSECYELSSKNLNDKIKQIDSLINMSICQYYNGDFINSISLLNKGKNIYDTISLGECRISPRDKIRLGIKLYTNSSMANLSLNNYKESIDDIKYLLDLIDQEKIIDKKLSFFKDVLYILFKVDTLTNIKNENEIIIKSSDNISDKNMIEINNINKQENYDTNNDNQYEKMMNDFLASLKYKNYMILLNSFIENASIYKKNNNLNGYYFCIFNQYLINYNNDINLKDEDEENNINKEEYIKEMKDRFYACYKNLLGEEIASNLKEKNKNKNITKFISEFNNKMDCSHEIFSLLENYENALNKTTKDLYEEKSQNNLKKLKSKFKLNEESPLLVKLCLTYSLNYLLKKKNELMKTKKKAKNKKNIILEKKESNDDINNLDVLIKELELLLRKISSYEIDISSIPKHKLNQDIIHNVNIRLKNLKYIYYKNKLYKNFKVFREKTLKIKLTENYENVEVFLQKNYDLITKNQALIKINCGTKGHKIYFYSIEPNSNTLNARSLEEDPYPKKSYSLLKDITRITYGLRSNNLIRKLKNKNEDNTDTRELLRTPWKFISFILKKKSVDLYCEVDQVDNWFYGLKSFTVENSVEFKIMSTNKFVINKIKYRMPLNLKTAIKEKKIKDENIIEIVNRIVKEKAFHKISFVKLILLYNKSMKI